MVEVTKGVRNMRILCSFIFCFLDKFLLFFVSILVKKGIYSGLGDLAFKNICICEVNFEILPQIFLVSDGNFIASPFLDNPATLFGILRTCLSIVNDISFAKAK